MQTLRSLSKRCFIARLTLVGFSAALSGQASMLYFLTGRPLLPPLKLPTISLPKFSGNLQEFMHFHVTFLALIINNDALTDIQRYYYLLSSLSGEPHSLIERICLLLMTTFM